MIIPYYGKPFHCLDQHIDIETFLNLKDDFAFLYAKSNPLERCDSFGGGGLPVWDIPPAKDSAWQYLLDPPSPYYAYHEAKKSGNTKILERIKYFEDNHRLQDLCLFLQLKYGAFNPYKKLHLLSKKDKFRKFIPLLDEFPGITNWLEALPFDAINECQIIVVDHYYIHKYHRDFDFFPIEKGHQPMPQPGEMDDWMWLRFELDRGFNLFDLDDNGNIIETIPIQGYSATMNNMNWHGNTEGYPKHSMTVKIEGKFTKEFKKKVFNV
jgi:hypothetical protein